MNTVVVVVALISSPPNVPSEPAASAAPVGVSQDQESPAPERDVRELLDLGVGVSVGLPLGLVGRAMVVLQPGLMLGAEVSLDTVLIYRQITGGLLVGWEFDVGGHRIRPQVSVTFGEGAVEVGGLGRGGFPVMVCSGGVEWKPTPWLGLGLSGGYATSLDETAGQLDLPVIRITPVVYY